MGEVKALTLHEPWATLIAIGVKRIETRSWAPPHWRGELAIHAAKTLPSYAAQMIADRNDAISKVLTEHFKMSPAGVIEHLRTKTCGNVLAVTTLYACIEIPTGGYTKESLILAGYHPDEEAFGDFSPGRFAWHLRTLRVLEDPIPARGYQGLWTWEH